MFCHYSMFCHYGDKICSDACKFCHQWGSVKLCRHCTFFFHLDISTCDIVCMMCVCVHVHASKRERERNMLGTYYATKYTRHCMEWNITPKVSPRLPSVSLTNTSHSIKEWYYTNRTSTAHNQTTLTAHRATGSSSLVVYSNTEFHRQRWG